MSCLDATFTLKPSSPFWGPGWVSMWNFEGACLYGHGADFWPSAPSDFSSLYSSDRFYFDGSSACDPNLDYTQWPIRRTARFLQTFIRISGVPRRQLILIFGFDVSPGGAGRVLVYSDSARLSDQALLPGDNQFAMEVDSLDQPFNLYFIHVGGSWFFRGISGYVV